MNNAILTTIFSSNDLRKLCEGKTVSHTDPDGNYHLYMASKTYSKLSRGELESDREESYLESLLKMIDGATNAQRMYAVEYIMEKFKKSFGMKTGTRMMDIDEGDEK